MIPQSGNIMTSSISLLRLLHSNHLRHGNTLTPPRKLVVIGFFSRGFRCHLSVKGLYVNSSVPAASTRVTSGTRHLPLLLLFPFLPFPSFPLPCRMRLKSWSWRLIIPYLLMITKIIECRQHDTTMINIANG